MHFISYLQNKTQKNRKFYLTYFCYNPRPKFKLKMLSYYFYFSNVFFPFINEKI